MRALIRFILFCLFCLAVSAGCATSASRLRPNAVPTDQGAFFGRIEVYNQEEKITGKCYANFTDKDNHRKSYVSLDDTGWVFMSADPGDTYLSTIVCTVGGLVKKNIQYDTRELSFSIPGSGKIAYFGDIRFNMEFTGSGISPLMLLGGAGAGVAAGMSAQTGKGVVVANNLQLAIGEYERRYKNEATALTVVAVVPSTSARERLPASQ